MTCKDCKFLDVPPNKAGRIVTYAKNVYRCVAPEPTLPVMPASITYCMSFRWPPPRCYMTRDMGANCPTYQRRD